MKKKILSFLLGVCMSLTTLFSLTSCSLVKKDYTNRNNQVVLKIGDTSLSRSDVVNAFYTYYQNNSNYFAYYGEDVIEDSFYQWAIVRQMLSDKSLQSLYDAEENPQGYIYYTKEDAEQVWKDVSSYIYTQVSNNEKNIYALKGFVESNYPKWIKTDDTAEEDSVFQPYEKPEIKIGTTNVTEENPAVKKLTKEEVVSKIDQLKQYLFEYVTETDEDGNEQRAPIDETNYIPGARNQAYTTFIGSLISTAKSNGTSTDAKECLENEVYRIYEAYYSSKVTTIFQNYYLNDYLTNFNNVGDADALSNSLIVKAFLEEYFTQKQLFGSEKGYIDTITNSEGAPLILISYNGENYYFSVQHILISFTERLSDEVKLLEGYSSSSSYDYDAMIAEYYRANRDNLTEQYELAMLAKINEKNEFDSIEIIGDYYYYDEEQKLVYDTDKEIYNGYIKLRKTESVDADGNATVVYTDSEGGTDYEEDSVVYMANLQQVYDAYDSNFGTWKEIVTNYYNGSLSREDAEKDHEDMIYVFDTVDAMKEAGYGIDSVLEKVASYLFVELEWIYSGDSLGNELSNKVGYMMSNYDDDNGSWVVDFANGAKELVRAIEDGTINISDIVSSGLVSNLTNTIVSDYGYHIIKVENIYKQGESVNKLDELLAELISEGHKISYDDEETVEALVKFMKGTFVSTASNETLFDYFYDLIYTDYIGSGNSSGTYFLDLEYKWLNEFYSDGEIEFVDKMSYSELMNAIQ